MLWSLETGWVSWYRITPWSPGASACVHMAWHLSVFPLKHRIWVGPSYSVLPLPRGLVVTQLASGAVLFSSRPGAPPSTWASTAGQPGTLPGTAVQHSHRGASIIGSWWSVCLGFPSALGRFPVSPHSCPWASLPPAILPWSPLAPLASYPKAGKAFLSLLSNSLHFSVSAFHPQWWGSPNPDGS